MGVKWKTTTNKLPEVAKTMKTLNKKKVIVGALEGEHAWLAGIHEYGVKITVTPKMRAYLHKMGLHLKDSTTHITIPERSFLRSGHDEYANEIISKCEKALGQVVSGQMSIDTWLDMYGQMMSTKIKTYIRDLDNPPNHPYTIDQKGSSNPLIDSGAMVESIIWKKD